MNTSNPISSGTASAPSPYDSDRYCKAQLLHALAKHIKAGGTSARSPRVTCELVMKCLPPGARVTAVCVSWLPGLKATVSGIITDNQTITGCNDGTHGPHPISEWPQNCAPSAAEKLPAAEEDLLSSITVNELPESFVDDYIQDTAERKQLLKQHLKLKRPVEVWHWLMNGQRRSIHDEQSILFYTNTNLPLCDGYHLPGCHNCSDCRWKSLVFCSGCPAAFHSECLGKYGMKPPSGYVDMTSQSNRPHPGCGDLWLCPLCCEKLESNTAAGSQQLPRPHMTQALMSATSPAHQHLVVPIADFRKLRLVSPRSYQRTSISDHTYIQYHATHSKYHQACLRQEAVYRQWLVSLGVTLPDWLEPLPTMTADTSNPAAPSIMVDEGRQPTPEHHSHAQDAEVMPAGTGGQVDGGNQSSDAAPGSSIVQAPPAATVANGCPDDVPEPPAKRVCTAAGHQGLHMWPLVAVLLRVFKPLLQLQTEVAGASSSSSNNKQQAFAAACAASLQHAWTASLADLQQSIQDGKTEAAAEIRAHGSSTSCRTACELFAAAHNMSMEVPTAAAELAAVTALCKSSMDYMQAGGEGSSTPLQAWNILQASSAFLSKVEAAADAAATTADGIWMSVLQNAVATLLAALLEVGADDDAENSISAMMVKASQTRAPTAAAKSNGAGQVIVSREHNVKEMQVIRNDLKSYPDYYNDALIQSHNITMTIAVFSEMLKPQRRLSIPDPLERYAYVIKKLQEIVGENESFYAPRYTVLALVLKAIEAEVQQQATD